jgi:hypothetical protein
MVPEVRPHIVFVTQLTRRADRREPWPAVPARISFFTHERDVIAARNRQGPGQTAVPAHERLMRMTAASVLQPLICSFSLSDDLSGSGNTLVAVATSALSSNCSTRKLARHRLAGVKRANAPRGTSALGRPVFLFSVKPASGPGWRVPYIGQGLKQVIPVTYRCQLICYDSKSTGTDHSVWASLKRCLSLSQVMS